MVNAFLRTVDKVSERTGQLARWLVLLLILVLATETVARYVFNSPTTWAYETSFQIGGCIVSLAWCYVHKHGGHIRVDVLYQALSARKRAIIDVTASLVFLFPLLFAMIYGGFQQVVFAWEIGEKFIYSSWMSPTGPVKTIVFVGFCLFALQCIAQFIRAIYALRGEQVP